MMEARPHRRFGRGSVDVRTAEALAPLKACKRTSLKACKRTCDPHGPRPLCQCCARCGPSPLGQQGPTSPKMM
jgi:hypothetical protein